MGNDNDACLCVFKTPGSLHPVLERRAATFNLHGWSGSNGNWCANEDTITLKCERARPRRRRRCASVKLTDGFGWNFKEETESRHLAASSESFLFQLRRRLNGETGLTNMTDSSKIQLSLSPGHTEAWIQTRTSWVMVTDRGGEPGCPQTCPLPRVFDADVRAWLVFWLPWFQLRFLAALQSVFSPSVLKLQTESACEERDWAEIQTLSTPGPVLFWRQQVQRGETAGDGTSGGPNDAQEPFLLLTFLLTKAH